MRLLPRIFTVLIFLVVYLLVFLVIFSASKRYTYSYLARGTFVHTKNVRFQPILTPKEPLCRDPAPYLVIYVHSAPAHLEQRTLIRKTYAHPHNVPGIVVRTLFAIGVSAAHQEALSEESAMYGDILQEDYVDSYRNLSLKALSALRFINAQCQHARFVLKCDDDIFVNIFALVRHLQSLEEGSPAPNSIFCFLWPYMPVMRDPKSKWYVSQEEWPQEAYTNYCSGSAFVLTLPVVTAIVNVVPITAYHWVDDFYVTGLLADSAMVHKTPLNPLYRLNFMQYIDEFRRNFGFGITLLFSHTKDISKFKVMWNRLANSMHGVTVSHLWRPVLEEKKTQ